MENLFPGFDPEAFSFFLMIRLNNNKEFFDDNKEQYERLLKEPLYALAAEMEPFMLAIDKNIDARAHRAVARIRRSTRYTKDKSPYRDHLWISWRRRNTTRREMLASYIFTPLLPDHCCPAKNPSAV